MRTSAVLIGRSGAKTEKKQHGYAMLLFGIAYTTLTFLTPEIAAMVERAAASGFLLTSITV